VEDEHRYGLISFIRRRWTLQGHRCTAPYHTHYEWGYVYVAAEGVTGGMQVLYTPTVSLAWTQVFLEQLVQTDPEAWHLLIWDQAGYHPKPGDERVPEQLSFLPLPPYCPELNPMEGLWDQVKARLANEGWETLEKAEAAITEVLKPFGEQETAVRSLLGDGWLTTGVTSFLEKRNSLIIT